MVLSAPLRRSPSKPPALPVVFDFAIGSISSIKKKYGVLSEDLERRIRVLATPYRSSRLIIEGGLAIFLFVALFGLAAFLIPPLMYRLDIRSSNATVAFLTRRRLEIEALGDDPEIKEILLQEFDSRFQAARDEIQIIKFYHREQWKSLVWYFTAVFAAFGLLILSDYLARKIG